MNSFNEIGQRVTAAELSPEMLSQAAEVLGVSEEVLLSEQGCEEAEEEAEE